MKRIKLKLVFLAVGLVISSICGTLDVFAEDNSSTIIISPMMQKLILIPGETTTQYITVSNPNSAQIDLKYSVKIGSFSQKQDGDSIDDYGTVDTDIVSNYNMIMDWITLEKDSGSVAPNETDTVRFTINVPETAPAGGQYATILVKDDTERVDSNNGNVSVQSITQIASIIYAEVAGDTRSDAEILENDLPGLLMTNELTATSMVKNNGNVHTNAKFTLQVWPLFGDEEICTNEENPTESLVMPETSRYHIEECHDAAGNLKTLGVGIYRVKHTVKIFNEESIVEKTIIVCPLWLLFLILFVIIALIMWVVVRVKGGKKTKKTRTAEE